MTSRLDSIDSTDSTDSNLPFRKNRILAALPAHSLRHLSSNLRPLLFHNGTVLYEAGSENEVVYFPKTGVLSLVLTSKLGIDVEVGLVGPEGVVGALDALDQAKNSTRVQVQLPGSGWALPASILRQEFARSPELQSLILRYQRVMAGLAAQNTLCNRLHSIEQRLAKWLLLVQDRVQLDELELTHEFIAAMLGSRRAAVSLAANSLRDVGLIDYRRGIIAILDRPGLELLSCECYPILRKQYQQEI